MSPGLENGDIEEVVFEPGDCLFRENEQSFHFYIIQEGQVEVFKTNDRGAKIALAVVGEGTSIGELAMIDKRERSATAIAVTQVRAARINENAYRYLLEDLPEWAIAVMRTLVERIRQTNEIIRHAAPPLNSKLMKEIQVAEFDSSGDTFVDESPLLSEDDDKGDPQR